MAVKLFAPHKVSDHGVRIATARADNVIGGGDWSANRLLLDLMRTLAGNSAPTLLNAGSLRPWQHVLEPLAGYLWLGAHLAEPKGEHFAEAWNFGPQPTDVRSVGELADAVLTACEAPGWHDATQAGALHEASLLRLSIDKAVGRLSWRPVWDFAETAKRTAGWYKTVTTQPATARAVTLADLDAYLADAAVLRLPFAK